VESGEGIESITEANSRPRSVLHVESGEGIESRGAAGGIWVGSPEWNPVKELKGDLRVEELQRFGQFVESGEGIESCLNSDGWQEIEALVESGEGIESVNRRTRTATTQSKWNPVKELKDPIVCQNDPLRVPGGIR